MQRETESRITAYSKDRQNAEARESFLAQQQQLSVNRLPRV
jgi:hypothetical protein